MYTTEERDTYKYHLMQGGKVVYRDITYDPNRREAEHQREFPGSRIKQVGRRTTREKALKWKRRGGRRSYKCQKLVVKSVALEIASIPTKNYKEIIEVRVPTRFYWNDDGTFDGIEFGGFRFTLLPWQEDMVMRCLDAVGRVIENGGGTH